MVNEETEIAYGDPQVICGPDFEKPADFPGDLLQWRAVVMVDYIGRYGVVPVAVLREKFGDLVYEVCYATYAVASRYLKPTTMGWKEVESAPALRIAMHTIEPMTPDELTNN